jgi:hypothetical protein
VQLISFLTKIYNVNRTYQLKPREGAGSDGSSLMKAFLMSMTSRHTQVYEELN